MKKVEIAPSILSADFGTLLDQIKLLEQNGVKRLHLDVMDGHFVPNISFGQVVVKSLRKKTNLIFETHLMITNPLEHIESFKKAGSDIIIFHQETVKNLIGAVEAVKELGVAVGVSINPSTPLDIIKDVLGSLDMVLIMTVNPGFGGQEFIMDCLKKIEDLSKYIKEKNINLDIAVDGGINSKTAPLAKQAGANILIAGSSIFGKENIIKALKEIENGKNYSSV